jgi:hypothetical protein
MVAVGAVIGCAKSGTDTGNPVWISECKSESEETKSSSASEPGRSYAQLTQEELPIGLECLLWETEPSGAVTIHMHNFSGGCGVHWQGAVEKLGPTAYRLRLTNPSCNIAGCGSCVYDSDFSIDVSDAWDGVDAASVPLELTREQFSCDEPNEPLGSTRWSLPLGTEPSGVRCEWGDLWATAKVAWAEEAGGQEFLSCGELGEPCVAELSCVDTGVSDQRCLASCTTTDDCASSEIAECRDGYCVPRGF